MDLVRAGVEHNSGALGHRQGLEDRRFSSLVKVSHLFFTLDPDPCAPLLLREPLRPPKQPVPTPEWESH